MDILTDKVGKINNRVSTIRDEYIEKYLKEDITGTRKHDLTATTDGEATYRVADFVIIAKPTNYDFNKNSFNTTHVEEVIELVKSSQSNLPSQLDMPNM